MKIAVVWAALFAAVSGRPALAGQAGSAHGYADTWNGRQYQQDQAQVAHREKRAGIAPSPARHEAISRTMHHIDRRLVQESPVVRQTLTAR